MPQDAPPLHPVAAAFAGSELVLSEILERTPEPRDKMVQAMLALRAFLGGKGSWEEALDRAESVRLGSFDPCLTIIFLGLWAISSRRAGRLGEVKALARMAGAMGRPEMPPEIRSMAANSECIAASVSGDWFREDRAMRRMLGVLPESSPRYATQLLGTTSSLAYRWSAMEFEPQLDAIAARSGHFASSVAFTRLVQYAETGRVDEARAQLPLLAADPKVNTYYSFYASGYRQLLDLMAGLPEATAAADNPDALLLAGRKREALELARRRAIESPQTPVVGTSFGSFDLVRAELASGNREAGLRLLRLRAEHGNLTPASDFFAARVELLGGRRERALRLLRSFLDSVQRYRARGRLEFELRLAPEMSPADAAMLRAWCDGRPPEIGTGASGEAPSAEAPAEPAGAARLAGTSPRVEAVRQSVARLAGFTAPVLVCGEPGSGKRIVARALHESGPRARAPFVEVGCAEVAASLLPLEVFGRGSPATGGSPFRGALAEAGDGALLLRDVDRLPPELQVALLEVIETGEVRSGDGAPPLRPGCRLMATTSADLAGLAESGRFDRGLFERFRRMAIAVPSLAERPADVPLLVEHFLAAGRGDGRTPRLSEALCRELVRRAWPRNVTELRELAERMRLAGSEKLDYDLADLPAAPAPPGAAGAARPGA